MPEMIDVLDENYSKTGQVLSRPDVHNKELWHASIFVWIYNSNGEVLVQLRAKDKDMLPDVWDVSVGGHISAGETPLGTVLRECEEEINLKISLDDIEEIGQVEDIVPMVDGKLHKQLCWVYILKHNVSASELKVQESELSDVKWVSIDEVLQSMKLPNFTQTYSARNKEIYLKAFKQIGKNLGKNWGEL